MIEVRCEWQTAASLGEGPLWVEAENAIYWLDILAKQVHRLDLQDGRRRSWSIAAQVTSLAERRRGGFIASVRDGFAWIDLAAASSEAIVLPEARLSGNRFNDGKVDAHGRYWAGSMHEAEELASGILYRLDADLSLHPMADGYTIANGPAFSPAGDIFYHTDSAAGCVYAFDLDTTGAIHNRRLFADLRSSSVGAPDGMTTDSEGCLWICHFGGARVSRYSPRGEVLAVIPMPVPNITSCTFGGEDLATLYITTARCGLDEEALRRFPLSGSLFSCRPGFRGLPTPAFAG